MLSLRQLVAAAAAFGCSVTAAATPLAPSPGLTLPLTARGISDYLAAYPQTTLEGFLAALPSSERGSFVLMAQSESRQQASPTQPRQIFFGPDARFLLAVSSVPTDPLYQTLEFSEFAADGGTYHYGTITFPSDVRGKPVVTADAPGCEACHGQPTRPIWGDYDAWTGAYSDSTGQVAATDRAAYAAFVAAIPATPRFAGLEFSTGSDGSDLLLTSRLYQFANTDFNHELGNTVALGSVTRLRANAAYPWSRYAVLATSPAMDCIDSDAWEQIAQAVAARPGTTADDPGHSPYLRASRLGGVDPEVDLSLEKTLAQLPGGSDGLWQTGAYQLNEAIAFQLLDEVQREEPALPPLLAPVRDTMTRIRSNMTLTGEPRAAALRQSYSWFQFFEIFDQLSNTRQSRNAACQALANHL